MYIQNKNLFQKIKTNNLTGQSEIVLRTNMSTS